MAGNADQYEQLSAYLDGELTEAERQIVEDWLLRDPKARQILDDLRRISGMVSDLPREQAPSALPSSVTAQFERDALLGETVRRPPARRTRFVRLATRLAAVAVLAIGATLAWYSMESESQLGAPARVAEAQQEAKNALPQDVDSEDASRDEVVALGRAAPKEEREVDSPAARGGRRAARAPVVATPKSTSPDSKGERGRRGRGITASEDAAMLRESDAPAARKGGRLAAGERESSPAAALLDKKNGTIAAADPFESRLRQNELTNADLREVRHDSLSNRVVLETDLHSAEQMVNVITSFMDVNDIPIANGRALPEPIPADQVFCYVAADSAAEPTSDSGSIASEGGLFVMNVEPRQAELLFNTLDLYAASNRVAVDWRANWIPDKSPRPAQEIIQSLLAGRMFAAAPPREPLRGAHLKDVLGAGVQTTRPADQDDEADEKNQGVGHEDETAKGKAKAPSPRVKRTAPAAVKESPIALAVEIRCRAPRGAVLQFPPQAEITTRATSAHEPENPAAATQPTSQRSEGG